MSIALLLFFLVLAIRFIGFQEMRARGVSEDEIRRIVDSRNKQCLLGIKFFIAGIVLVLIGMAVFLTVLQAMD